MFSIYDLENWDWKKVRKILWHGGGGGGGGGGSERVSRMLIVA